jgi:hypothetical protein
MQERRGGTDLLGITKSRRQHGLHNFFFSFVVRQNMTPMVLPHGFQGGNLPSYWIAHYVDKSLFNLLQFAS